MTFVDSVLKEIDENDKVSWQIVGGVFYYLIGRLLTTFLFAYLYGESWRIQAGIYGFPVIGFGADEATYALINSSSAVAIGLFVCLGALQRIHAWRSAPLEPLIRARALGWTLVSVTLIGQLYVGTLVNTEKELELKFWAILMISAGVALVVFYAFRSRQVVSNFRLIEALGEESAKKHASYKHPTRVQKFLRKFRPKKTSKKKTPAKHHKSKKEDSKKHKQIKIEHQHSTHSKIKTPDIKSQKKKSKLGFKKLRVKIKQEKKP